MDCVGHWVRWHSHPCWSSHRYRAGYRYHQLPDCISNCADLGPDVVSLCVSYSVSEHITHPTNSTDAIPHQVPNDISYSTDPTDSIADKVSDSITYCANTVTNRHPNRFSYPATNGRSRVLPVQQQSHEGDLPGVTSACSHVTSLSRLALA